jgi:hypothetical protein
MRGADFLQEAAEMDWLVKAILKRFRSGLSVLRKKKDRVNQQLA